MREKPTITTRERTPDGWTERTLAVPIVHLNGTSRNGLLEQTQAAYDAARVLGDALREMTPNGRDYYPAGPEAFELARTQHAERLAMVRRLRHDLECIAAAIQDDDLMEVF